MPYSIVTKDGIKINNIPDDVDPQSDELKQRVAAIRAQQGAANDEPAQGAPQPEAPEASLGEKAVGMLEAGATMASGAVAEPAAGIAGIVQSLNPMADPGAGAQAVEDTRKALTYEPSTKEGRDNLMSLAKTLQPVTDILQRAEKASGDLGYDLAGPTGGAIGSALPTAVMELLGLGAGKALNKVKRVAKAVPDEQAASILKAGEQFDVPVMTTDIKPPKGYAGRFAQSMSEKLGPLGSGTARVSQQKAREAAVSAFAEQFDIDIDSPFSADMVKSLNKKIASELKQAGEVRARAVESLDQFGPVPLKRTQEAVQREIAKQMRLGEKGDKTLIQNLENTLKAADGGDFSLIKDIRTEVISDLKAISRGEDTRSAASVQAVKSAMDKDMMAFARANDRTAAADWIRSNRAFGDAYSRAKDTELKRILKTGDATPEKIMTLIRGGKQSELVRLAKSMGEKGRESARRAIIQDALKESKFFEVDANPNPDAFATALNKANRQQAIKVFFQGEGKKEIDGLARLLNATRRAQQGSTVVKTGEQATSLIMGGGAGVAIGANAQVAVPAIATASAILKGYESKPFRNLLLKIGNTQPGSTAEKRLLEAAGLFVASGLQSAKEQPAEEQQTEEVSP